MGGAAAIIDVGPIGRVSEHTQVCLEPGEEHRGGLEGRPIGAVESDLEAAQLVFGDSGEVIDVALQGIAVEEPCPDVGPDLGPRLRRAQPVLELSLHFVGELGAAGSEELDPVVLRRVVGSGDDGAHRRPRGCGEIADPSAGQDADVDGVDTHRMETGLECGGEHLTRTPGVAAHHDGAAAEIGAGGTPDEKSQLRGEFRPGHPADTIGAEDGFAIVEETTEVGQLQRFVY